MGSEPPHIIVGTPGRILQLVRQKDLPTKNIKHFILDECDKMLEQLDMRKDVQEIFKGTPHEKQVMMFSATLSTDMRSVCKKFMQDPMEIYVNELLDALEFNQVVVFVKSVARAVQLDKLLQECNFPSVAIHASMKQEERIKMYQNFKDFKHRILVSTDIWGRGIDIERVNIVVNYDMPDSSDTYLHRVGRAGRFGTKGLGITFASTEEDGKILEDVQSRFEVSITQLPDTIEVSTYMTA